MPEPRIIGILSWYDEQPSMLGPCVTGFARICDQIIAVDGAYSLFPKARARSHPDQAETIMRSAEAAGVGCLVYRPADVWYGNEVEKRQATFELARPFADENTWLLVFDGDCHVMQARPDAIREVLALTEHNAATYTALDGKDLLADGHLAEYARRRPVDTEWTIRSRGLFRWTDDLEYGPAHYTIRGTYNGERVWIWGPDIIPGGQPFQVPAENLNALLVVYHRTQHRTLARQNAAQRYYQLRDQVGVEQFDAETLAADEQARQEAQEVA